MSAAKIDGPACLKSALAAAVDALNLLRDAGDLLDNYGEWKFGPDAEQSNPAGLLEEARARIERAATAMRGERYRLNRGEIGPHNG